MSSHIFHITRDGIAFACDSHPLVKVISTFKSTHIWAATGNPYNFIVIVRIFIPNIARAILERYRKGPLHVAEESLIGHIFCHLAQSRNPACMSEYIVFIRRFTRNIGNHNIFYRRSIFIFLSGTKRRTIFIDERDRVFTNLACISCLILHISGYLRNFRGPSVKGVVILSRRFLCRRSTIRGDLSCSIVFRM